MPQLSRISFLFRVKPLSFVRAASRGRENTGENQRREGRARERKENAEKDSYKAPRIPESFFICWPNPARVEILILL